MLSSQVHQLIIIINGSVGVGKTSTSWALLESFDKSLMLDGDHLGAVHPFEVYDTDRVEHLYRTIALLIPFHQAAGYRDFVVNYVFESSDSLRDLVGLLSSFDTEIFAFWLRCAEEVQLERIRRRNDSFWHLNRAPELNRILELASQNEGIGFPLDNTELSPGQTATEIKRLVDSGLVPNLRTCSRNL